MEHVEPDNPTLTFDVATDGDTVTVTLAGELDISGVDQLAAAPELADPGRAIVVDAANLRFADSSAIALWVRWAEHADSFELRDPAPLLQRVIERMGLRETLLEQA